MTGALSAARDRSARPGLVAAAPCAKIRAALDGTEQDGEIR